MKCALKGAAEPLSFKEEVVCVCTCVCVCVCVCVCAVLALMTKGKDLFGGLEQKCPFKVTLTSFSRARRQMHSEVVLPTY